MAQGPKPDMNGHLIASTQCCGGCGESSGLNDVADYQTSADPDVSTARDTPLGSPASSTESAATTK